MRLLFIIIFVIFLIAIPLIVKGVTIPNPLKYGTIPEVIAAITELLKKIAIPLGTVMVIISGIQYMTAGGSEERANKAKKTLLYTVIGVAIVIAVDFIVDIVKDVLGKVE